MQRAPLVSRTLLRNYPAMSGAPPEDRATFPLFGPLTEADAVSVRSLLRRRQVEAGATVFQRGDIADAVYLVVPGQLRISVGSANGRELAFRVIGPGDIVGEMGVLDGGRRSADLRQSVMLGLSRSALQTLLATRPAIASGIIAFLCGRLRETSEQMEALALQTVEARLARLLLRLAHAGDRDLQQDVTLALDMSQTEIATLIGASRPKVNVAFRELEQRGAIRRTGRNLQCRIQALEEVAEITDP
jgi:CRP/FNR family cyclic AMP-dependent transcriptional regulator